MERIRERMAQEVGGYVSVFALFYADTDKKRSKSNWIFENIVHEN